MKKGFLGLANNVLLVSLILVVALIFSPSLFVKAEPITFAIIAGVAIDYSSCDLNVVWGCGGSNSDNGGGGSVSCGDGEQLCAGNCIPADADCCARLGSASYCPTRDGVRTYCSSSGQCRTTPCAANDGQTCTSAANSCGQTSSARYNCDGVCSAAVPPDSSCPNPEITITATGPGGSQFVNRGSACTIRWTTTNSTSCTLSGPGVSTSGTSGQIDTPPIQNTTTYTLSCRNGTVVTASRDVTCYLNPYYEEF